MELVAVDSKAIEVAAASADPRVRAMAIRFKEIENEAMQLSTFLGLYASLKGAISSTAAPKLAVAKPNGAHTPSALAVSPADVKRGRGRPRKDASTNGASAKAVRKPREKTLHLIEKAVEIVKVYGQPMPLTPLFDALRDNFPALCPGTVASLAIALKNNTDKIAKTKDGFWPVSQPDIDIPSLEADEDDNTKEDTSFLPESVEHDATLDA